MLRVRDRRLRDAPKVVVTGSVVVGAGHVDA
jgi:hypothetical protein